VLGVSLGQSCAMTAQELKKKVESYREALKKKKGVIVASEAGPVGIDVIDSIVTVLEAHEKRIEGLEGREHAEGGL
jgi:hypothetical protein